MDENIAASLQEIAGLLRRRVEQQDEQARRSEELHRHSEERFAKMEVFKSETPDFSQIQEDGEKQISEIRRASEERLIENNKKVFLRIKDSGPGFEMNNAADSSIGVDIIHGLIDQINATMAYDNQSGSTYDISFTKS